MSKRGEVRVSGLPLLAAQWHPTRNGDLTPEDVALGSHKRIWWRCPVRDDHEWDVAPYARAARPRPESCPFCVGQRVTVDRSLAALKPEIAAQWHPTRNGDLTPEQVGPSSGKRVWWLCPDDPAHEWDTPVSLRGRRETRCPYCSGRRATASWNLAVAYPDVAALLHPDAGPAEQIAPRSGISVPWKCPAGPDHEWEAPPYGMVACQEAGNPGCPYCAGKRPSVTNSVASVPRLAAEYHPDRNPLPSEQVLAGTNKRLWWRCAKGHDWQAQGTARLRAKHDCPWCSHVTGSGFETDLVAELRTVLPDINAEGDRLFMEGRVRQVDLLVPSLRLAVEVDGSYWHRDKADSDRRKTQMLADAGWTAVRLREAPLKPLGPLDCTFPKDATAPEAAQALLEHLAAHGIVTSALAASYRGTIRQTLF
jgi:hypothetical protein